MLIPCAIIGAYGRMGQAIILESIKNKVVSQDINASKSDPAKIKVQSGLVREKLSTNKKKDQQYLEGDFLYSTKIADVLESVEVAIDFSSPELSIEVAGHAERQNIPYVIGSTGFSQSQKNSLVRISKKIPILLAANTSIAVNILFYLTAKLADLSPVELFDIEIIEKHHAAKVDSPSGTALVLQEILQKKLSIGDSAILYGRPKSSTGNSTGSSSHTKTRNKGEIAIHSVRGGGAIGKHEVLFLGKNEEIHLNVECINRETYAVGALMAASWLAQHRKKGLYSMLDVLGMAE